MQALASNPLQAAAVGNVAVVSVEVSVMDMERRGRHTQATGIIQLLNKEEDMMKEAKPFVIDRIFQSYELPEHGACLLGTQEI